MVYNINVEFQITNNQTVKQSNIQSNKQNGQDKKSESTSPTRQERRINDKVRIEVGES